jgi:hypothetical protein
MTRRPEFQNNCAGVHAMPAMGQVLQRMPEDCNIRPEGCQIITG